MSQSDIFVFCVGENDKNRVKLVSCLYSTLEKLKQNKVFILNVSKNIYLNEDCLNNEIELICNLFPNCYFLKCPKYYQRSNNFYCKKINYILDCNYYENRFLNPKTLRKHLHPAEWKNKQHHNATKKVKGTIPYYFPLLKRKDSCDSILPDVMAIPDNSKLESAPSESSTLEFFRD